MAIDIKKINVVLPEGVSKVGELQLKGEIAELVVLGETIGKKLISVSYGDTEAKTGELLVTDATLFRDVTLSPTTEVTLGEMVTLTAVFSKPPVLDEVVITSPEGFNEHTPPAIQNNNIVAQYIAGGEPTEAATFEVTFRETDTKQASIKVNELPAAIQRLEASKSSVRVGEEFTLSAIFDKAPKDASEAVFVIPSNFKKGESKLIAEENTISIQLTAEEVGDNIVLECNGMTTTVNVPADAVMAGVVAFPNSTVVGETCIITATYDKPRLDGQPEVDIVVSGGLIETGDYDETPEKSGGTMLVKATGVGTQTVTFRLGNVEKVATIEVSEAPTIVSMDVVPNEVEVGNESKVILTFSKE